MRLWGTRRYVPLLRKARGARVISRSTRRALDVSALKAASDSLESGSEVCVCLLCARFVPVLKGRITPRGRKQYSVLPGRALFSLPSSTLCHSCGRRRELWCWHSSAWSGRVGTAPGTCVVVEAPCVVVEPQTPLALALCTLMASIVLKHVVVGEHAVQPSTAAPAGPIT